MIIDQGQSAAILALLLHGKTVKDFISGAWYHAMSRGS